MILFTILTALATAFLYRLGGLSKEDGKKYLPFFPTWVFNRYVRRLGVPLISFLWMIKFYPAVPWWIHFLSSGFMFGMMTTYWDFLTGEDNYWMHGFMIGISYILYSSYSHLLWGLPIRAIVLAVAMGLWCEWFSNDWVEELGRGAFIGLTLPLMLIGG